MDPRNYNQALLQQVPLFDVEADTLNNIIARHIKENQLITPCQNYDLIKTSMAKELAPSDPDWYFKRAASVFRSTVKQSLRGSQGIGSTYFARKYASKRNRGCAPNKKTKGSRGHVLEILNGFSKIGWVEKAKVGWLASDEGMSVMRQFIVRLKSVEEN